MSVQESRAVVVVGMPRSGTSVTTQLISELGLYAGRPDELMAADPSNPTGFWEYLEAVQINRGIFAELGASWTGVEADLARLSDERRTELVARMKGVVRSLQVRGSFVLKDPRICLLFPLWREVLPDPICVIAWRHPMAVARSLATRELRPLLLSLAEWEHYYRTVLRDTTGASRLLVAYEDLMADPIRLVHELHDALSGALSGFGLEGLKLPSEERIRQIVNPDFNRSGPAANAERSLLDEEQRSLLVVLQSGAALREPVPPTAAHKLELFAEFGEVRSHRKQLDDYDALLREVFESGSITPSLVGRWKELLRQHRRA